MRLPINCEQPRFIAAGPAKPVPVFNGAQGEVKTDREGRAIYSVELFAASGEGGNSDVITVKLPGPVETSFGDLVSLRGLTAEYWEMGDRSGVSFRAEVLDRGKSISAKQSSAAEPAGKA